MNDVDDTTLLIIFYLSQVKSKSIQVKNQGKSKSCPSQFKFLSSKVKLCPIVIKSYQVKSSPSQVVKSRSSHVKTRQFKSSPCGLNHILVNSSLNQTK